MFYSHAVDAAERLDSTGKKLHVHLVCFFIMLLQTYTTFVCVEMAFFSEIIPHVIA